MANDFDPLSFPAPNTDALSDIVYIVDLIEQRNVFINKSIQTALLYSAEDIAAMGSDLFPTIIHPDDLPTVGAHYERLETLEDGAALTVEYRVRRKDGVYLWYRSTDSIYRRDESGAPRLLLGSAFDISQLKAREATIALLNRELAHRVQNLFAVNLSMVRRARKSGHSLHEALDDLERRIEGLGHMHRRISAIQSDESVALRDLVSAFFDETDQAAHVKLVLTDGDVPARLVTTLNIILYEMSSHLLSSGTPEHWAQLTAGTQEDGIVRIIWEEQTSETTLSEDSMKLLTYAAGAMDGVLRDETQRDDMRLVIELPLERARYRQAMN